MHFFRLLMPVAMVSICLACASGSVPEKAPRDIHQGIRHLNKATAYYIKGCYPKALQHIQEAHERFAVSDDLQGSAESLNTMANIYYRLGDLRDAAAVYDEAIGLFEQLQQDAGRVRALANKSATLIDAGRIQDASQALDQSDALSKDSGMLRGLRLKTRAMLHMAENDAKEAENLLVMALAATPESDQVLLADIRYSLAQVMISTQRPQQAIAQIEDALRKDRAAGAYFSIGLDLASMGSSYEKMERYAEAVDFYKRSLKIFALLDAIQKVQWVLPRIEACALKAGLDLQTTLRWTEQWLAGQREAGLCR